jgi:hypothetical protein
MLSRTFAHDRVSLQHDRAIHSPFFGIISLFSSSTFKHDRVIYKHGRVRKWHMINGASSLKKHDRANYSHDRVVQFLVTYYIYWVKLMVAVTY